VGEPRLLGHDRLRLRGIVGRNCRFLQGPETDRTAVATVAAAVRKQRSVTATLVNYRKDGSSFWNDLTINSVLDAAGRLTHFVGMPVDVTSRIEADAARERALLAEHDAAVRATTAQAGLALLAEASDQLAHSLDGDDALHRLAALVVPTLADRVAIQRVGNDSGSALSPIVRHRDEPHARSSSCPELLPPPAAVADQFAAASTIVVPLPGRDHVVGTMELSRDVDRDPFSDSDYALAVDVGRRVGLTVENSRLYQGERRVAETLQRSLLPTLPDLPDLEIAARYNAAQDGAQVGGDFYDVLALPTGRTAIVIGDVAGHDINAAAAMGHLRGLIQAVLLDTPAGEEPASPNSVLRRVDRLVQALDTIPMATSRMPSSARPRAVTPDCCGTPAPATRRCLYVSRTDRPATSPANRACSGSGCGRAGRL
jgi:PAS domain S-box-containing protein